MNKKLPLFALAFAMTAFGTTAAMADGAALYTSKGCIACHGADAKTPIMPMYPKLAGQNADYLLAQAKDIKSGARKNGQSVVMMGIVAGVTDEELKAIADWIATQ